MIRWTESFVVGLERSQVSEAVERGGSLPRLVVVKTA